MKNLRKSVLFLTILLVFSLAIGTKTLQKKLKISALKIQVKAGLNQTAKYYKGVCPVNVKMTGVITVSAPITVKYRFERSDRVQMRLITLTFNAPGSKTIPFNWKLDNKGWHWVELVVKLGGKEYRSGHRDFNVECDTIVRRKINIRGKKIHLEKVGQVRIINPNPVAKQIDYKMKAAPKVADLKILGIKIEPHPGKYGQSVKFSIGVKNLSPMREEHSKSCYLSIVFKYKKQAYPYGDYVSEPYYCVIPEIGSGSKITLELYFKLWNRGTWTVSVCADAKKTVPEFDENNNCSLKFFLIYY